MNLNQLPARLLSSLRSRSYDVLPALSVRGPSLRHALQTVTIAWMFGSVWMISIGGATMAKFATLLGFTDLHWGIWQAIGFAAMLFQLPASYIIENTGLRKLTFLQTTTMHRLLWIPVGMMPLLLLVFPEMSSNLAIWLAFGIIFVSGVLGNIGSPAWVTWMSDLIPNRIRGRYFARRNAICVAVQMVTTLALGLVLYLVIRHNEAMTPDKQPALVWTLAIIFLVAGLAGATDILLFRKVRDVVPPRPPRRMSIRQIVVEPIRNRRFMHFSLAWATMTFGVALSGPFILPLFDKYYQMNAVWMNFVLMVCGPMAGVLSSKYWGRLSDRWGRLPVLFIGIAGSVAAAWVWLLIPHGLSQPALVALTGIAVFIGGVTWTGVSIAQFNMLLGFSDESGRSAYVASMNAVSSIAGIIGGLLGGQLAVWMVEQQWQVGPLVLINYHTLFFISGLIRGASLLWLVGMKDPGAKPARQMVRAMVNNAYYNMTTWILWPMRVVVGSRRASYRTPEADEQSKRRKS